MSSTQVRPSEHARPLVAVVCAVPLLGEAMESALDFAEVRSFSASGVDSEAAAEEALEFASEHKLPVLLVLVQARALRLFRRGGWEDVGNGSGPEPETIRNVLAGVLFARGGVTR